MRGDQMGRGMRVSLEARGLQRGFGLNGGPHNRAGLGQAGGILAQGAATQRQQRLGQFPVCHHLTMAFQQAEHLGSQFGEGRCLEPAFAGFAKRRREGLPADLSGAGGFARRGPVARAFGRQIEAEVVLQCVVLGLLGSPCEQDVRQFVDRDHALVAASFDFVQLMQAGAAVGEIGTKLREFLGFQADLAPNAVAHALQVTELQAIHAE